MQLFSSISSNFRPKHIGRFNVQISGGSEILSVRANGPLGKGAQSVAARLTLVGCFQLFDYLLSFLRIQFLKAVGAQPVAEKSFCMVH